MSGNSTKSLVNNYLASITSVLNTATQSCSTFMNNNQSLNILCDKDHQCHGDISITNLDWTQMAHLDAKCTATQTSDSGFNTSMTDVVQQGAESIAKSLNITDDSSKKQLLTLCTTVQQQFSNAFMQNCSNQAINNQSINVINTDGNIFVDVVNMKQTIEAMTDCAMKSVTVSKSIQDLTRFITDHGGKNDDSGGGNDDGGGNGGNTGDGGDSSDTEKKLVAFLKQYGFFVAWSLLIILVIVFTKFQSLTNVSFYFLILFGYSLYLSVIYLKPDEFWPYSKYDANTNKSIFIASVVICSVSAILGLLMFFVKRRKSLVDTMNVNTNSKSPSNTKVPNSTPTTTTNKT